MASLVYSSDRRAATRLRRDAPVHTPRSMPAGERTRQADGTVGRHPRWHAITLLARDSATSRADASAATLNGFPFTWILAFGASFFRSGILAPVRHASKAPYGLALGALSRPTDYWTATHSGCKPLRASVRRGAEPGRTEPAMFHVKLPWQPDSQANPPDPDYAGTSLSRLGNPTTRDSVPLGVSYVWAV